MSGLKMKNKGVSQKLIDKGPAILVRLDRHVIFTEIKKQTNNNKKNPNRNFLLRRMI